MTKSRRFIISLVGVIALTYLGISGKNVEAVALPIAMICMGVAAANAYQKRGE